MIDNDFEDSVDDTADEMIMTMTKMHEIAKKCKMSIFYTVMILAES